MNRLANATNLFQGKYKRVLCVCSAGLLRSPTAALVLSQEPYNYNTRATGLTKEFALVPVDRVLLHWADEIVCMNPEQAEELRERLETDKPVIVLNIEDRYRYRDPELVEQIKAAYDKHLEETNA
jgi:predicted protein tyrosine phosphatase